jgi:hypothetical protein
MTMRTLSEDIFIYKDEDMDEQRYLDLVNSLHAAVVLIVPILRRFMVEKLRMRRKAIENREETAARSYEKLVISTLELWVSLSEWTDYQVFEEHNIFDLLCELLFEPEPISMSACDCFLIWASRKAKDGSKLMIDLFRRLDYFQNVYQSLKKMIFSEYTYSLQKRICQILSCLVSHHLGAPMAQLPPNLDL